MTALTALLGACFGLALVAVLAGVLPASPTPYRPWWARITAAGLAWPGTARRAGTAVAAGVLVGAVTRWPVAAILSGVAVITLPSALGGDRHARQSLARTEAVAVWAEMLRDSLSASAGLEQTILLTSRFAPPPIAAEVTALAASLRAGGRLSLALQGFASSVDDPTARLVARALAQAGRRQSRQLPDLLSELAHRARDRANLHLRIAPGHARIRTNARIITGFTLAMAAGLTVFNRDFLRPYDSPLGQAVLLAVGIIFAAGLAGLSHLARTGLEPVSAGTSRPEPSAATAAMSRRTVPTRKTTPSITRPSSVAGSSGPPAHSGGLR